MKIRCIETGRKTEVKRGENDELLITDAMTRLIRREPEYRRFGHYASTVSPIGMLSDFREYAACRRAEVIRPIGGLTEHTGDFYTFEEID